MHQEPLREFDLEFMRQPTEQADVVSRIEHPSKRDAVDRIVAVASLLLVGAAGAKSIDEVEYVERAHHNSLRASKLSVRLLDARIRYCRPMPMVMRCEWFAVAAAITLAACHGESTTTSPGLPTTSTSEVDALWALAPLNAKVGFVASPRALTMAQHGWQDFERFIQAAPELAPAMAEMRSELLKLGLSTLSLAEMGLAPGKGLASFGITEDSTVLILPVVDRERFLAVVHGTKGADYDTFDKLHCKPISGSYACADDVTALGTLGKGSLREKLGKVGVRGDAEAAGAIDSVSFAVVAQLSRGAVVLRGTVEGVPKEVHDAFGRARSTATSDASGFFVLALQPLVAKLAAEVPATPIAPGVDLAALAGAVSGVLEVYVAGGSNALDARVGLRDIKPATALVEHCSELPIPGKLAAGRCRIQIPTVPWVTPELWVDNDQLRVRVEIPLAASAATAVTAIGSELAHGEWSLAFWGRGTPLAGLDWIRMVPGSSVSDLGTRITARVFEMVNEVGGGLRIDGDSVRFVLSIRTTWANPDEVVAKIVAIPLDDVLTARAGPASRAIADAAPTSAFAADLHAGAMGILVSLVPVALIAGYAMPTALDQPKKRRRNDADLRLTELGKAAERVYAETGKFPVGTATLLPANPSRQFGNNCCGARDAAGSMTHQCTPDPAAFAKDPVWRALGLSIDEPTPYQFDYKSDGKTFTAHATADLDCDGKSSVWEMRGWVDGGTPRVELVKPAPGVY